MLLFVFEILYYIKGCVIMVGGTNMVYYIIRMSVLSSGPSGLVVGMMYYLRWTN